MAPHEVESKDLLGLWRVSQPHNPSVTASLLLERHPEHEDSLRGVLRASAPHSSDTGTNGTSGTNGNSPTTVWLVGDIEDGELVMDESQDGQRISAIWTAQPVPGSCGRQLNGERRAAGEDTSEALVMTRPVVPPPPPPSKKP